MPGWEPWAVATLVVVAKVLIRVVNLDGADAAEEAASVVSGW